VNSGRYLSWVLVSQASYEEQGGNYLIYSFLYLYVQFEFLGLLKALTIQIVNAFVNWDIQIFSYFALLGKLFYPILKIFVTEVFLISIK